MKSKVYLETTIVSYLVASSTHDIIQAAHQQVTREWWTRRERFDLFVSRPVLTEAGWGDATAAARRLETLASIPVLSIGRGVTTLANTLIRTGTLPTKARLDAVHVAIAAVNGMDYLLTWNLRHLANAAIRGKDRGDVPAGRNTPADYLYARGTDGGLAVMRRDPIVEEVRRNREAIAREHGDDVDAIVAAFQREEATSGVSTVSFPPKRVVKPATRRKPGKTRRPNKRMEPTRPGSRKRAAHS